MPTKPKRPCRMTGCNKLCDDGEQYCEQHKSIADKQYNKFQRDYLTKKRYGRAWKRIRDRYIKAHPLCEECLNNARITTAQEVHHIIPLSEGGNSDENNLMALCKPCHSRITLQANRKKEGWG